jgi:hypothetical protein
MLAVVALRYAGLCLVRFDLYGDVAGGGKDENFP